MATVWTEWAPGARLDLARIRARFYTWKGAVRYGGVSATVVGAVRREGEEWLLEASGTGQRFRLVAPHGADRGGDAAWDAPIAQAAGSGARLRVTGEVREGRGEELILVPVSIRVLPR